jgi:broad specificity phosphatase PhoE
VPVTADRVLLWRHGRTSYNRETRFQGQRDIPMDETGREQVELAADALAEQVAGAGPGLVRIVASDLSRAADTGRALAARLGLPVELDPAMREVFAGEWQGLSRREIQTRWPEEYEAWRRGDDMRVGGGETRREASARTAAAIRTVDAEMDGGILVVAGHGGTLRGALLMLIGLEVTAWASLDALRNAHWAELRHRGDGWALRAYNVGAPAPARVVGPLPAGDGVRAGLGE